MYFFQKSDWLIFGVTSFGSLVIYVLTLIPSVNLEESGEFCHRRDVCRHTASARLCALDFMDMDVYKIIADR